jgi:hypothetical protein
MAAAAQPQEVQVVQEPTIVAPTTKNAKVKGTWTMYFGANSYDFVDGRRYDLPLDLYTYLVSRGNIYDTL